MVNILDYGDPYIEWEEANSAQEEYEYETEGVFSMDELKDAVVKLLVLNYDFLLEEAEEKVEDSIRADPSNWHENATAEGLAKMLASDDEDE